MTLKILNMALVKESQINVPYGHRTVPMEQSIAAAAKPGLSARLFFYRIKEVAVGDCIFRVD